jgi:hypothetical protein
MLSWPSATVADSWCTPPALPTTSSRSPPKMLVPPASLAVVGADGVTSDWPTLNWSTVTTAAVAGAVARAASTTREGRRGLGIIMTWVSMHVIVVVLRTGCQARAECRFAPDVTLVEVALAAQAQRRPLCSISANSPEMCAPIEPGSGGTLASHALDGAQAGLDGQLPRAATRWPSLTAHPGGDRSSGSGSPSGTKISARPLLQ